MKTRLLFVIFISISSASVLSQAPEKAGGLSDIKLAYSVSSMSAGGDHFRKGETIIPFGIGSDITFNLSRRFFSDIGIGFRTTGKRITDSFILSEFGYSGPVHSESMESYLDIPVHIKFRALNTKPFKMFLSFGPKGTITHVKYYSDRGYNGQEYRYKGTTFSTGLDFGITESLKITGKTGIFASQSYGYYLTGDLKELEIFDLSAGLVYFFK